MDVMDELRGVGATPPPRPATLAAVRTAILEEAREVETPRRRRWLQHPVLSSVAAVVLVSGGSAAVLAAVSHGTNPRTTTTIECGVDTFIPEETGSPILDCYQALAQQGGTVPPLVGWVTSTGLVAVLPSGQPPPDGSTPLPPGFQVDTGVRYLTDSLGDVAGPLLGGCLASPAAVQYADRQLAIAELSGWQIRVEGATASTGCTSYVAVIEAQGMTIDLQSTPIGSSSGGNVTVRLDERLHSQLVSGPQAACLSTAAARSLADRDAAELGLPSDEVIVSDGGSVGSGRGCATPFVEAGGGVDVVLWQVPRG